MVSAKVMKLHFNNKIGRKGTFVFGSAKPRGNILEIVLLVVEKIHETCMHNWICIYSKKNWLVFGKIDPIISSFLKSK